MIRILSILVGLFFTVALAWSLLWDTIQLSKDGLPKSAAHEFGKHEMKPLKLASDGPFGKFDKAQLKRGFEVYTQVCSSCHAIKHVAYRDLAFNNLGMRDTRLAADPEAGDLIRHSGGLRKARMKLPGRGRSAGARASAVGSGKTSVLR